jgi:hypothetical protein
MEVLAWGIATVELESCDKGLTITIVGSIGSPIYRFS